MTYFKPTHFYIGRQPCGCVTQSRVDTAEMGKREAKETGRAVAEMIASGLTVERLSREQWQEESKAPGFLMCFPEHWAARRNPSGQLSLLEARP